MAPGCGDFDGVVNITQDRNRTSLHLKRPRGWPVSRPSEGIGSPDSSAALSIDHQISIILHSEERLRIVLGATGPLNGSTVVIPYQVAVILHCQAGDASGWAGTNWSLIQVSPEGPDRVPSLGRRRSSPPNERRISYRLNEKIAVRLLKKQAESLSPRVKAIAREEYALCRIASEQVVLDVALLELNSKYAHEALLHLAVIMDLANPVICGVTLLVRAVDKILGTHNAHTS